LVKAYAFVIYPFSAQAPGVNHVTISQKDVIISGATNLNFGFIPNSMKIQKKKLIAIIVAHPDDETLWAGGTILNHPNWRFFIVCLCRANDAERAPRFYKALQVLKAEGVIGNLDDGPEQKPLSESEVEQTILQLLPLKHYDLIITHSPKGEYTRHLRHEEIGRAVINLWHAGKISANELWIFAYEDGQQDQFPHPVKEASVFRTLPNPVWRTKYNIITKIYDFKEDSWEAETTPKAEAFWQFLNQSEAKNRLTM
jgi:LmbE family N-acetylglucosaminyl deacetylase